MRNPFESVLLFGDMSITGSLSRVESFDDTLQGVARESEWDFYPYNDPPESLISGEVVSIDGLLYQVQYVKLGVTGFSLVRLKRKWTTS